MPPNAPTPSDLRSKLLQLRAQTLLLLRAELVTLALLLELLHFGIGIDRLLYNVVHRLAVRRGLGQRSLQQHILGLEVRVDDAAVVEEGEARKHLRLIVTAKRNVSHEGTDNGGGNAPEVVMLDQVEQTASQTLVNETHVGAVHSREEEVVLQRHDVDLHGGIFLLRLASAAHHFSEEFQLILSGLHVRCGASLDLQLMQPKQPHLQGVELGGGQIADEPHGGILSPAHLAQHLVSVRVHLANLLDNGRPYYDNLNRVVASHAVILSVLLVLVGVAIAAVTTIDILLILCTSTQSAWLTRGSVFGSRLLSGFELVS